MKIFTDNESQKAIERANKILSGFHEEAQKAVIFSAKRAMEHLNAEAYREATKKYAVSQTEARKRTRSKVWIIYNGHGDITMDASFAGRRIPLYKFSGSSPKTPQNTEKMVAAFIDDHWRQVYAGKPAKGHQLVDTSPTLFEHAFTAKMSNGYLGIFSRDVDGSIHEIQGNSVPQMLGNEEVSESLAEKAKDKFEERLDHEINRILNGWG